MASAVKTEKELEEEALERAAYDLAHGGRDFVLFNETSFAKPAKNESVDSQPGKQKFTNPLNGAPPRRHSAC
jgi:hypothetical protein